MPDLTSGRHASLHAQTAPALSFDQGLPLAGQRERALAAFSGLLRMPRKETEPVPHVEFEKEHETFTEIRFSFESEPGFFVPAHLLLPKGGSKPLPVVICLQGHSTGMHISLGRPKYEGDEDTIAGDRDFALQAVARGYAAVAMEQRGFGELKSAIAGEHGCHHPAMQALLLGRTLLGERAFDVSRLIDALAAFSVLDLSRIGLMGNSGGGTASYHAACVEPRVRFVMPSCAFNTYGASIFAMHHCACNYIPDILKSLEMPDLAMMLAPRPLVIVSGETDEIFPLHAVQEGFETVKAIYRAAGVENNCALVVGKGGHRFYAADAWPVFDRFVVQSL